MSGPASFPLPVPAAVKLLDLASATSFDAAHLMGVDERTVRRWIEDGMPAVFGADRRYIVDLTECVKWIRARDARTFAKREENSGAEVEESKRRKLEIDVRMKELDLQRREGQLLDRASVENEWKEWLTAIREAVMAIPGILVQAGLVEPTSEQAVESTCRDALSVASESGEK